MKNNILPDDGTFKPFIVRVVAKQRKTTEELYSLAKSRNLKLTKNQRLDTGRPTQFAWQHQLRRDQYVLANRGIIRRYADSTWGLA
jgi:hypothetical protein